MRRRFLQRLAASKSLLHFVVTDGALSEAQAWKLYEDAFWDGLFDEQNSRDRERQREFGAHKAG